MSGEYRRETIAYDVNGNRLTPERPPRPMNDPPRIKVHCDDAPVTFSYEKPA